MTVKLGVNVDHVATLRQARGGLEPDPATAAAAAEQAGADGITVHLREDRRHINENDVRRLRRSVRTKLNLEMSVAADIVAAALRIKPDQATLVPERRRELTTEGGLQVASRERKIAAVVTALRRRGIQVSLFIDPERAQIAAARRAGAQAVELHTGAYANAKNAEQKKRQLRILAQAAAQAYESGLRVYAGHGLNYENTGPLAGAILLIEELNIGHAIISRAVFTGLAGAVRQMKDIMITARKIRRAGE